MALKRRTFVSLLGLSQVDLSDRFEVDVPQSDAAVSATGGETLFAGIHAEDTSLHTQTHTEIFINFKLVTENIKDKSCGCCRPLQARKFVFFCLFDV